MLCNLTSLTLTINLDFSLPRLWRSTNGSLMCYVDLTSLPFAMNLVLTEIFEGPNMVQKLKFKVH